jgi:hypothetical protein
VSKGRRPFGSRLFGSDKGQRERFAQGRNKKEPIIQPGAAPLERVQLRRSYPTLAGSAYISRRRRLRCQVQDMLVCCISLHQKQCGGVSKQIDMVGLRSCTAEGNENGI